MKAYKITVEVTGTKTFVVSAEDMKEVLELIESYGSLDNFTNAHDDRVEENIVEIKELSV